MSFVRSRHLLSESFGQMQLSRCFPLAESFAWNVRLGNLVPCVLWLFADVKSHSKNHNLRWYILEYFGVSDCYMNRWILRYWSRPRPGFLGKLQANRYYAIASTAKRYQLAIFNTLSEAEGILFSGSRTSVTTNNKDFNDLCNVQIR